MTKSSDEGVFLLQDVLVLVAVDDEPEGPLGRHEGPHPGHHHAVLDRVDRLVLTDGRVEVVDGRGQAEGECEEAEVPVGSKAVQGVPVRQPGVHAGEVQ